jgi:hypothetical protein
MKASVGNSVLQTIFKPREQNIFWWKKFLIINALSLHNNTVNIFLLALHTERIIKKQIESFQNLIMVIFWSKSMQTLTGARDQGKEFKKSIILWLCVCII